LTAIDFFKEFDDYYFARPGAAEAIHDYVKHICAGERSPGDVVAYKRGVGVVFTGDTGRAWRMQINGTPGTITLNKYGPGVPIKVPACPVGNDWDMAMLVGFSSMKHELREVLEHGK
jgi:hypothetical protein